MPGGGRRDAVARCAGLRPTTEPLSGFRENTFAARGHRRGDQHRSACRLAGGTATGQDADLALCGTGACARPVLGDPLRLNRAHTPLPDFFAQCRQPISILYYCNNLCSTKKQISTSRGYFSLLRGVDQQYPPVKCTAPFVSRNYSPLCPETRSGYSVQETPCAIYNRIPV